MNEYSNIKKKSIKIKSKLRFVTVKQDRLSKTLNTENNITKFEIGPVQNKLWIPLFEAKITLIQ